MVRQGSDNIFICAIQLLRPDPGIVACSRDIEMNEIHCPEYSAFNCSVSDTESLGAYIYQDSRTTVVLKPSLIQPLH